MGQQKFSSFEDLQKAFGSGEPANPSEKKTNNPPPRVQTRHEDRNNNQNYLPPELLTPADTAEKVRSAANVEHFGLKLTKYLIRDANAAEKSLAEVNFREWVAPNFDLTEKMRKNLLASQRQGAELLSESLFAKELSTTWRLAVGLGTENVLETSMTLHHTLGIPYIPGQALKGVVRSYVVNMYFENEKAALRNKDFCMIFGGGEGAIDERAGNVIFFDVLPTEKPEVIKDIMNPHFGDYYSDTGKKPPGDYYDPIPVPFRTVKNTRFLFMSGLKKGKNGKLITGVFGEGDAIAVVGEWIEKSLSIFGIGAKTSVGYGRFE